MAARYKKSGFTLIELMITLAILGVLAAMAIGEFLSYQAKSKAAEAKINLDGIHKMASAYASENGTYATDLNLLGWKPNTVTRYKYWYNGTEASGTPTAVYAGTDYSDPGSAADAAGFTAFAVGNVDSDTGRDVWSYNFERRFTHHEDDVTGH